MQRPTPSDDQAVLRTRHRAECMEFQLVLEAAAIASKTSFREGWWLLVVAPEDWEAGTAELDAYRRENPVRSTRRPEPSTSYSGATIGVLVYSGIILLVAALGATWGLNWDLVPIGAVQSGRVMAGEWWRTVTALTLHADAGHVAANLVFGVVFGLLVGQALGGGVGWLAIVTAGALGNFISAMVQSPDHTSIGASTAVFAALGILVSYSLGLWSVDRGNRLRRWSPLIGGVLLLALTGVGGPRTDVMAHVTGFLSGLLVGWFGCRLPSRWLADRGVQTASGLASVAIVVAAWAVGIVAQVQPARRAETAIAGAVRPPVTWSPKSTAPGRGETAPWPKSPVPPLRGLGFDGHGNPGPDDPRQGNCRHFVPENSDGHGNPGPDDPRQGNCGHFVPENHEGPNLSLSQLSSRAR